MATDPYVLPNGQKMLPVGNDPANGDISGPPIGYKFTHLSTEYQYFPETYFSGADVTVYFGDIFVDDVTGLQFILQENVRPIYGYADYAWSEIARGTRLVQGQFRIAFKEAGHLFVILDHLGQLGDQARPALGYLMTNQPVPNWHAAARQTIEDMLDYYNGDSGRNIPKYKSVTEQVTDWFDWPEMGLGASDSTSNGCVSKLQNLLIKNGYSVSEYTPVKKSVNTFQRFSNVYGKSINREYNGQARNGWDNGISANCPANGGHWPSWIPDGGKIPAIDPWNGYRPSRGFAGSRWPYPNCNEAYEPDGYLEYRLWYYDTHFWGLGLNSGNGLCDDSGNPDYKYGDSVRNAVAAAQWMMEYAPGTAQTSGVIHQYISGTRWIDKQPYRNWGGWVDQKTAEELSYGLSVSGYYGLATKSAVWKFQRDHEGETVAGPKGETGKIAVTGIVDNATRWLMSKLWNTRTVTKQVQDGIIEISRSGNPTNLMATYMPRVKHYEQEIWGRSDTVDPQHNQRTFFYDGGQYIRSLKKTGFDIYITYGPIGIWGMQNQSVDNPLGYIPGVTDGDPHNPATAPFPNTVHAIRNVQLISVTQILNADGQPIEEVYDFIAKDLD